LQRKQASDPFAKAAGTNGKTFAFLTTLPSDTFIRQRVRATDKVGNVSAWQTSAPFVITGHQAEQSDLVASGAWTTVSSINLWGGSALRSTSINASLSLTSDGSQVAIVATRATIAVSSRSSSMV